VDEFNVFPGPQERVEYVDHRLTAYIALAADAQDVDMSTKVLLVLKDIGLRHKVS
jgi:hypothetical protein